MAYTAAVDSYRKRSRETALTSCRDRLQVIVELGHPGIVVAQASSLSK